MLHLLDTDTVIYILKRRPPAVAAHFEKCAPEEVAISSISIAELMFGAEKSQHPAKARRAVERIAELLQVLPFDEGAARVYGKVRSRLERLGTPIGALDTLIGAHALSARATLVTNNVREFERIPGLRVENWISPPA
jgi:tRNA(fMet)-specific endonuclease VapC